MNLSTGHVTKAVTGIDPGQKGALCLITEDRQFILINFSRYTWDDIARQFLAYAIRFDLEGAIEGVNNQPGEGGTSSFHFGIATAHAEDLFLYYFVPYERVYSQTWLREFNNCGYRRNPLLSSKQQYPKRKKAQYLYALLHYPDLPIDEENANAVLIADWKWRKRFGRLGNDRKPVEELRPGTGILHDRTITRERR